MTILPAYLFSSTQLQVTWLICLPWAYSINYLPQQISTGSPILISKSITELSPTTQIKLMLIASKNYAKACEQKLFSLFSRVNNL